MNDPVSGIDPDGGYVNNGYVSGNDYLGRDRANRAFLKDMGWGIFSQNYMYGQYENVVGNNLKFTITNQTTISSLITHPATFHIWPNYLNPTIGPLRTVTQTYIFTEPIRK